MILSFLFFAFLFYVLFKLVFDFILPIYRTTQKVKQRFRDMHHDAQAPPMGAHPPKSSSNGSPQKGQETFGDYIDFEEVKE
ncbi:hypothetical protein [Flavisolibacter nicotianae]|uniref:hypothetical protein n=1 Tax=Flavisolibacter nicotianae TaxID=2364882 RepID=UPI0013C4E67E|nr:hypothetical protein [Flavisolibacter nicotianae]